MHQKRKRGLIFLSVALFLTMVMSFIAYLLLDYVRSSLEQDVKVNLMEIAKQNAKIISEEVALDLNQLELIGELMLDRFESFDEPGVADFLHEKVVEHDLYGLMAADLNGTAYSSDRHVIDISKRIYFKNAQKGISHISEQLVSKTDGNDIYVASVPIYKDKVMIGTLHRVYPANVFAQIFDISLFNNKGYINVINESGEVNVHSAENGVEIINNNYYRELYLLGNVAQAEQIKNDLAKSQGGFVELKLQDRSSFAAYTTIDQVHGWNLVTAVPSEVISKNANIVTRVFFLLLAVLIVMFVGSYTFILVMNQKSKKALEVMAFVDSLTNGNNYNKFLTDVPEILETNPHLSFAVIKLDVDNFKYINDMHGFDFGDSIIRSVYTSLSAALLEHEFVARGSGDNFFALMQYVDEETVVQRISQVTAPILDAVGIFFSLSCGVCRVEDVHENLQILVDKAGIAAKSIKGNSKKTVAIYSGKMSQLAKEEEEIKQVMQKALENREFEPFYQPKVNVFLSQIQGAEVLVRWRHPEKGLIAPFKFIPVFEKTGFIVDIDLYMFECVCKKIKDYLERGIPLIPISVNFSRVHLYNKGFLSKIKELVTAYQIPPQFIEIELTESAIFDNLDIILAITLELQAFGFILSMDDFGSGYSSLNMLKEIPINVLKIDKEFFGGTSDNERREIVIESIVEMAHKLNIKVIAEGVETLEQVDFLKKIECTMAQGYFYAKPLPDQEFDALYRKGTI